MSKRSKTPGGGMGGANIMRQIQQLQEQMVKAQAELADESVTGSAGGGVVTAVVTGDQKVLSVSLDPELIKDGDKEIIEDLILTAINQGLDESRKLAEQKLGPLAGGGLPF